MIEPQPEGPSSVRAVQYKGEPLDAERGPGLGCFRFQLVVLVILVVLTPLSVAWDWPTWLSAAMLFGLILLLFLAGQTIIFLLRLVAADRRAGRRRPLDSPSRTVGQIEDAAEDDAPAGDAPWGDAPGGDAPAGDAPAGDARTDDKPGDEGPPGAGPVPQ